MVDDISWKQRFDNFDKALMRLRSFSGIEHKSPTDINQVAVIGAFEFTFELAWKTIKDYLGFNGINVISPREAIK